jgi:hypothetical protein
MNVDNNKKRESRIMKKMMCKLFKIEVEIILEM